MKETEVITLEIGPVLFESSTRSTEVKRLDGDNIPGQGSGIGSMDLPLKQFRDTLDPALRRTVADELLYRVSLDPRHADRVEDYKNQLVHWLGGHIVNGEVTHTSLEFGRVVLESFHNRTHAFIYADPAAAWSYSGQLDANLPLDQARLEWSSDQKFTYARQVFDDSEEQFFGGHGALKKILDVEYPGGSELAHMELLKWLHSDPVRNQD